MKISRRSTFELNSFWLEERRAPSLEDRRAPPLEDRRAPPLTTPLTPLLSLLRHRSSSDFPMYLRTRIGESLMSDNRTSIDEGRLGYEEGRTSIEDGCTGLH